MQNCIDILESCSINGNSKQKSLQSGCRGAEGLSRPAAFRDLVQICGAELTGCYNSSFQR